MSATLVRCDNTERILKFFEQDHLRFRHLIHYLNPPSKAWDDAMYAYYPSGVKRKAPPIHFVDNEENIALLASLWDGRLRLDGTLDTISQDHLWEWYAQIKPYGVLTTTEALTEPLAQLAGEDGWSVNFHYTVTPNNFLKGTYHSISELTPNDKDAADEFLAQPSDVPFLSIARVNDNLRRDLDFMYTGLPGMCLAAKVNNAIVAILTSHPQTNQCEELSRLYVAPQYRCKGFGKSLLSAACERILARGLIPACASGGDLDTIDRLLTSIGFRISCRFWHRRYWWDTVECRKSASSST